MYVRACMREWMDGRTSAYLISIHLSIYSFLSSYTFFNEVNNTLQKCSSSLHCITFHYIKLHCITLHYIAFNLLMSCHVMSNHIMSHLTLSPPTLCSRKSKVSVRWCLAAGRLEHWKKRKGRKIWLRCDGDGRLKVVVRGKSLFTVKKKKRKRSVRSLCKLQTTTRRRKTRNAVRR